MVLKPSPCHTTPVCRESQTPWKLPCLPSGHISDNRLFYGDYEIIGHIPIGEKEDYPIMYDLLRGEAMRQCCNLPVLRADGRGGRGSHPSGPCWFVNDVLHIGKRKKNLFR